MSHSRTSVRLTLLRWHRRAGLLAALFVLVLSVTGLFLNHSDELALDQRFINSKWLLDWYGIETGQTVSYPIGEQWVTDRDGAIHLDTREVASCKSGLAGASASGNTIIIACRDSVSLLTTDGQVIERVDSTFGLPVPIDGLLRREGQILISSAGTAFEPDFDQLEFNPLPPADFQMVQAQTPPAELINMLMQKQDGHSIHWERVLLDLHSGRLFGRAGVFLFDLAAVLLIFLAASGFYYWASKPAPRR